MEQLVNNKENKYSNLALIEAALTYRSNTYRLLNIHQILLVYKIGILLQDHNHDHVRLCYLHNGKHIRETTISARLKILIKKGLVINTGRAYTFTALGWQHYNLLDSLLIRYSPIYRANYQRSAKNIKRINKPKK